MGKDKTKVLDFKVVEPIPIRIGNHESVFANAASPYAGLLWLDFIASQEAQNIIDINHTGSVFVSGTTPYQLTQGKKAALIAWEYAPKLEELQKKIFEAYGFPRAETAEKK